MWQNVRGPNRMRIDLRRLEGPSGRLEDAHVVDAQIDDEAVHAQCDITVDYRSGGSSWHLKGSVRGAMDAVCHRCLEATRAVVEGDFDVIVRRSAVVDDSGEDSGQDFIILSINEHEVDLSDFVHEAFVLNVPMQIVCSEECRGLCHTCGANLNDEKCRCGGDSDPRWSALRALGDRKRDKTS